MSTPDLDKFRAQPSGQNPPRKPKPLTRHRKRGEWFLKGPIPGAWLNAAGALPGKAFHVGVALWHAAGMAKQYEVKMTHDLLTKFGVLPDAGSRALKQLEAAGLVSVVRHDGRGPMVTIKELDQ
ncbi:MAG: helix-turn-helix domain-containing protein [Planctomycetota bacterium]|nr:helix-turn-helix domain-containing protein [Planctomycetota bacterium]